MMTGTLQRHAVVYCARGLPDDAFLSVRPDQLPIIRAWIEAGRPLIARMRRDDDPVESVALGLPLPLNQGKQRIALALWTSAIARVETPPLLEQAIGVLPDEWRHRLQSLLAALVSDAASVNVVGSLAWQFLTGLSYLHPRSDIDLIITMTNGEALQGVLDKLLDSDRTPGPRVDGEIVRQNGDAVAWRELCTSSKDIMVKSLDGPRICRRHEWLSQFQVVAA